MEKPDNRKADLVHRDKFGQASAQIGTKLATRSISKAPRPDTGREDLLRLKNLALEWLRQHNCNRGAANCIPGAEALIQKIDDVRLEDVAGHLFHAHLVRGLHESDAFDVDAVEVIISQNDKRPKDIRLKSGTGESLFVEAWRGKTPFGHARDRLAKKRSGSCTVNMEEDARKVVEKYRQLPPGKGFVINYATGTDQSDIPPIARLCTDEDKCVITVRSNMQAYVYGPSGFRHMEDVRRMCGIFGWRPNDMLGKLDSADMKAIVQCTIGISITPSAVLKPAQGQT